MVHIRTNLPIVSLTGTYGGKVLGSLSNLKMNACSSSGVISSFGLETRVVGGGGGKGTDIGVIILMGGGDVSSSFLSKSVLSMFLERGINTYMPVAMVDADVLGDICF